MEKAEIYLLLGPQAEVGKPGERQSHTFTMGLMLLLLTVISLLLLSVCERVWVHVCHSVRLSEDNFWESILSLIVGSLDGIQWLSKCFY